jgi:hypothetical protein
MLKNNKLLALCQPDMDWGDMKNTHFPPKVFYMFNRILTLKK